MAAARLGALDAASRRRGAPPCECYEDLSGLHTDATPSRWLFMERSAAASLCGAVLADGACGVEPLLLLLGGLAGVLVVEQRGPPTARGFGQRRDTGQDRGE